MRKVLALVAFVLLAALAAVWFLASGDRQAAPDSTAPAPDTATDALQPGRVPSADPKRKPGQRQRTSAADPELPAPTAEKPEVIAGGTTVHVVRDMDVPVPGARVLRSTLAGQPSEAVSDAAGRAHFASPPRRGDTFEVTAPGMAKAIREFGTEGHGVPPPGEIVEVELVPGADARGVVVDAATGRPVERAIVEAVPVESARRADSRKIAEAMTVADGSFVLRDLPADTAAGDDADMVVLRVDAAGFAPVRIDASELGVPPWTLRLDASGRLRGTVRGPGGRVAANSHVAVELALGDFHEAGSVVDPRPVKTDADGRFDVAGLRLDWTYLLRARNAEGTASAEVAGIVVSASGSERSLEVTLHETANPEIRVQDAAGNSVAKADVLLCRADEIVHEAATDAESARFTGVETGPWQVLVLAEGFPLAVVAVELGAGPAQPVVVTLDAGWTLRGRVVDDLGRPAQGKIMIGYDRTPALSSFRREETAADATGAFRLVGLGPEVDEIKVYRDRSIVRSIDLEGPVTEEMKIVLPRQVEVRFTFRPRTVTSIDWEAFDGGRRRSSGDASVSAAKASFSMEAAKMLVIKAEGYLPVKRELDAAPGASVDLGEVVFAEGVKLRGRVVDGSDHAVANASVWIWSQDDSLLDSATTGPDGGFEVPGMPEEKLHVGVDATGYVSVTVDVGAGPLVVRVVRGGLVRARAVDAAGRDVPDLEIVAIDAEEDEVESNEGGKPLVARLAPGRWTIVARRDDEVIASSEIDVAEGGEQDVTLRVAK